MESDLECEFRLEGLEQRIAPATLSFVEADGDTVLIKTSKGTDAQLAAAAVIVDGQLRALDLSTNAAVFAKTNINISVVQQGAGGDGQVHVGSIDAAGVDLNRVFVGGDIGKIVAGDDNIKTMGLASLEVKSSGKFGLAPQGGAGDLVWNIKGGTRSLSIEGDVVGSRIAWEGDVSVASVFIGGSLIGGSEEFSGTVALDFVNGEGKSVGSMKKLFIGGDVVGGTANSTGMVSGNWIGKVFVGGSLIGGDYFYTGSIITETGIGSVEIEGSLQGGEGDRSGSLAGYDSGLKKVLIKGSLLGAAGWSSASINGGDSMISLRIEGSVVGASGEDSASINTGKAGDIFIFGALEGSSGANSASLWCPEIGSLRTGGLLGSSGTESGGVQTSKIGKVEIFGDAWWRRSAVGGASRCHFDEVAHGRRER